jgi:lauroyl-KDO2-lipid IV(A) myristoyltransferase
MPGLLHPRHWPAWLALGLLSLGLLLPRRWRDGLAHALGRWQYRHQHTRRKKVELNLAWCFPESDAAERQALARDHFCAWTRAMADQPLAWWDARGYGRALTPYAAMSTMANRLDDPVLQWVVNRARARHGPVWLREGGIRPVVRGLRRGTVFYYMPDEDQGPRDSVFAPFFGQPKATLTSLARLAQLAGAVVLPMMACYDLDRRRYRVELRAPLADFPSGDAVTDATTMNRALEASIRRCPAQYLWNQRLFRTRPDGSRLAYPRRPRRRKVKGGNPG